MPEFPHLTLRSEINGLFKPPRVVGGGDVNPTTAGNLNNRAAHGTALTTQVDQLAATWEQNLADRQVEQLPELPDPNVIPLFLQVDPNTFDIESLKGFGIEIIAEELGGFIIGAAANDFGSLREKIERFVSNGTRTAKTAELWQINDGLQWRVDQILSEELRAKWAEIGDDEIYTVDAGIACYYKMPEAPTRDEAETDEHFNNRLARWEQATRNHQVTRDEVAMERQTRFEQLVGQYGGEIPNGYIDFNDSFSCRVNIPGKGLKDIVLNYPYLFEVIEHESNPIPAAEQGEGFEIAIEITAPDADAPRVCIIDSGIQEEHRLLRLAIDPVSHSFVPNDASTADSVANGGHGTRVAGAALYPTSIPRNGNYQLPFFIQNARVLSGTDGRLSRDIYPPFLMEEITSRYEHTKIFNLSINSSSSCRLTHMSQWAAMIDKIMYEKGVLFVISAGNVPKSSTYLNNPGIREHVIDGRDYPNFLYEASSRIANPAQSSFAITVGSVCIDHFDNDDKNSFGRRDEPSSFSRAGLGLWGMVKPDVVEYGGDFVREKNANPNLSLEPNTTCETVRSTFNGGSSTGKDNIGTSFTTPKVTHILAQLQKAFPDEHVNFYRALLIQSARLPENSFVNPTVNSIRNFGYGIPNLSRALENSTRRVTLVNSGTIEIKKANVYYVKVPPELRGPANEYTILIEVTLSFMAEPRRTRRQTKSYLSNWLDWHSSKHNETHEQFCHRILRNMGGEIETVDDPRSIRWVIRERADWSRVRGIKRQDSTIQKSWCTMSAHELPQELSIAVVGHKGWNKNITTSIPYSIAVSFEVLNADVNIYEMIRVENQVQVEIPVNI